MYVFYVPWMQTAQDGGGAWTEAFSSVPFSWSATPTNSATSNAIPVHMGGHADNGEVSTE